jgi:NitT/TauT family transport system substrate-binding protein
MVRVLRFLAVPALLITALALFAACSDDDEDPADPTSETTSAATAASTEPGGGTVPEPSGETVTLGFSAWPGWFPWQVAEKAGIFEEVGLDVELTYFEGYIDSLNALAAGQIDANSQTLNDTLTSVSAGAEQVIVLVNDNSTGNDQIIVTGDINTIEDLAGKTIGVEVGVVDHFLLLQGLESVDLSESDVTIQPLLTDAAAAAFAAGQLDAVGAFAPFTTQALTREGSKVLFDSADFPGSIPDHLVVSKAMVDERPGDVALLVEAWFKTLAYIEANPEEATAIMATRAGVTPEEYASYDAGTTIFTLEENIAAFEPGDDYTSLIYAAEQIATFLVDSGLAEEPPDTSGIFDSSFVEDYAARQ